MGAGLVRRTWTAEALVSVLHLHAIRRRSAGVLRSARRVLPRSMGHDRPTPLVELRAAVEILCEDVEALVREIERLEGRRA